MNLMDERMLSAIALGIKRGDIKEEEKNIVFPWNEEIKVELSNSQLRAINDLFTNDEETLINKINDTRPIRSFPGVELPKEIIEIMLYAAKVTENDKVADLFCGTGMSLLEISKSYNYNIRVDGYERNDGKESFVKLVKYANKLKNVEVKGIKSYNINKALDEKYDVSIGHNFWINTSTPMKKILISEINKQYKEPKLRKSMSYSLENVLRNIISLNENGRAVVISVKGLLSNKGDLEARRFLLKNNLIETIINLPKAILYDTGVETTLIVINKDFNRKNKDKIKYIDLTEAYIKGRTRNFLEVNSAKEICDNDYIFVDVETILEKDCILNMDSYTKEIKLKKPMSLEDVTTDIFRGSRLTGEELDELYVQEESEMTHRFLELNNINLNGTLNDTIKMIKVEDSKVARYKLQEGDILLPARGGNISITQIGKLDYPTIANSSFVVIRPNKEKMNPIYLKVFLESKKGRNSLELIQSGVAVKLISFEDLRKLKVECPDLEEQSIFIEKYLEIKEKVSGIEEKLARYKEELEGYIDTI